MKKLPTFEEALEITKKCQSFVHKERDVLGYKVSIFDYIVATYQDFAEYNAFELRGLTFVHNPDGTTTRFLMLHKFFNLNQCEDYQYEDVKNKKVIQSLTKLDGSMIRFVRLPNGEIVAKTKNSFDNNQVLLAMECYKNQNLEPFIKETLDSGLAAIFELTSPLNQIVIEYDKTQLTLIQLRSEDTGEYISDLEMNELVLKHNVKVVHDLELTIDMCISMKNILNVEGWVLTLEDGQMLKIKTDEYCRLHGLLTNDLARENLVMWMILDEKIDDALAQLKETDPRKNILESMTKRVNDYLINKRNEYIEFVKNEFKGDRKEFALKFKKHPLFDIAVSSIGRSNADEFIFTLVKKNLKARTYRLEEAKRFVKNELNFNFVGTCDDDN